MPPDLHLYLHVQVSSVSDRKILKTDYSRADEVEEELKTKRRRMEYQCESDQGRVPGSSLPSALPDSFVKAEPVEV